jgi:hypothetical protein
MSFQYGSSSFAVDETVHPKIALVRDRHRPALDRLVDEDMGRNNPIVGFLIAMPLGAGFWLGLYSVVSNSLTKMLG